MLEGEEEEEEKVCMRDPAPLHTLCVQLMAREESRGGMARLSSACSAPRSSKAEHGCVCPPIPVLSLLGKAISGPVCELWTLPLVIDPNVLLDYFSSAEHSSSDRSSSWLKYPKVAVWL